MQPTWSDHLNSTSDLAPELASKDFVQWHLYHSDSREKLDLEYQTFCNILLTSAGTDALGMTVSNLSHIFGLTNVDED